jgi:predicted nucleic acid-binding protein
MTLVDTSVWANHFRSPQPGLVQLLNDGLAGIHPFVIGEIAVGNVRNRAATLADLAALPKARVASEAEVHHLLESHRLWGTGLGWIDLHLLASAALSGWTLLTSDRVMNRTAQALRLDR